MTKKPVRTASTESAGLMSFIGPVLKLAVASAAGRAIKDAATEATTRLAFIMAAGVAGAIGVFCLSRAVLEVLERYVDPAQAWACIGVFYGLVGGAFYYAAVRRKTR